MMEPLSWHDCSYLTGNSGRDSERWMVFLELLRLFTSFSDCFFIDEVYCNTFSLCFLVLDHTQVCLQRLPIQFNQHY